MDNCTRISSTTKWFNIWKTRFKLEGLTWLILFLGILKGLALFLKVSRLVEGKVKLLMSVDCRPLIVHLLAVTIFKIFLPPILLELFLLGFKLNIASRGILWIHFLIVLSIFLVFLMINFIYKAFNGSFSNS